MADPAGPGGGEAPPGAGDVPGSVPPCILCGGGRSAVVAGPPEIARCGSCGLLSLSRVPGEAAREASYQEEYYREGTGERFSPVLERLVGLFRRLRMRALLAREPGPGSILDVGCGRGVMLGLFRDRGWRVLGTQLSRTAAEAARRLRGIEVACGELTGLDLPPRSFDVVAFFHVLEHLERPDLYLLRARELLRDGGLLVAEVPNFEGAGFRLLGSRHFCVDFPRHLHFFTPRSLGTLLARAGFRVAETSRFSAEYSPFSALQNLLNALPGEPNRLFRALQSNREGERLRRSPATWLHVLLVPLLAPAAVLLPLLGAAAGRGNNLRVYCRKEG